jgi:hypothetical protein
MPDRPPEARAGPATNPAQLIAGQRVREAGKHAARILMFDMPPPPIPPARPAARLADRMLKRVTMRETISKHGLPGMSCHRAILIFVMGLGLAFCPRARADQSVTLAWDSSPDSAVAGYMIYYGNDGTNYTDHVNAGTNTSWTVTGLQEGATITFVVTAYDANNNQSPPSDPIVYYVPGVVIMEVVNGGLKNNMRSLQHEANDAGPAMAVNFPVAAGHTYTVQASTDLKNWETIWQTAATTNAWVQYQDPIAGSLQMRFYRTISD